MNRGVPPTARNARTGELTPPGMRRWARANRATLEFADEDTRRILPVAHHPGVGGAVASESTTQRPSFGATSVAQ